MDSIFTLLKGLVIGGTMLVPGVSGGSMAMILGIYNRLITSVSSFFKNIKKNTLFLAIFVVGALAGMVLFAKPLLGLINRHPKPMLYFFIGAALGGVPLMYKESQVKKISSKHVIFILVGILIVTLLGLLPTNVFSAESSSGIIRIVLLLIAGFIAALALILPGISVSYMLLVLGLYEPTMTAISEFDILFLMPLGIGVVLGILLTTRLLETVMTKFPSITYMVILGFILGSLAETFPGIPSGIEWLICILTFAAGFAIIYILSRLESLKSTESN